MVDQLERRYFAGHDGTRLAYYATGPEGAPALVISAGLGGGVRAWTRIIERFSPRVRIYAWDYRGLYGSDRPRDGDSYRIASHARDLACLLDHLALDAPILAGWSMGVQVTLELQREQPERTRAIVALHGAPGYPLHTAFDGRTPIQVSPVVFGVMRRHWRWLARPFPVFARSRRLVEAFMAGCQRAGIMQDLDTDMFHAIARDWAELDLGAYSRIFERLAEHDASAILPLVRAPTLVIGGGRDRFTPAFLSEWLARDIPDAELYIVPDATHFGLMEYPEEVADRIERFLDERGLYDAAEPQVGRRRTG